MMNWLRRKFSSFRRDTSGMAMIYMVVALPALLGITSFAVDLGYVYYVKTRLQTAADMGALAGASKLYTDNAASVNALATQYANANLPASWTTGGTPVATSTPTVKCLATITAMGLTCSSLSGGNALQVKVSVTVPLFFAKALGMKSIKLSADSMVSGGGSSPPPLNVAIVLDATASMNTKMTTNCGSLTKPKKIECASLAAKTLLTKLWASVDQVALYTYPPFDPQSIDVATCKSGNSGSLGQVSYATSVATQNYQMFDFGNSYMDTGSPPTGGLITTSPLVLALGKAPSTSTAKDGTNCAGLSTNGLGIGTSIADAINAAQAGLEKANDDLVKAGQPKRQNVMIILSDGDANGNSKSLTGPSSPDAFVEGTDYYGISYNPTKWVIDVDRMTDQCQAAVAAADAAAAPDKGTWVYSIAFESSNTAKGSCFTDRPVTTVLKSSSTTPKIAASETFTRACTSSFPCKSKSSAANIVSSTIATPVTSGSSLTQVAITAWGGTIATTCTQSDGKTSGTCTTTLTNATKIRTDTYDLKLYDTTACKTMQDISSDPSKFYSTDGSTSTNGKCPSAANPNFTDLVAIFNNVAASIMKKRRIPSSTT